eukprot:2885025-Rhodomonas_salina.1
MRKREHEQASSLQSVLENEGLEEDLSSLIQTIAQAAISLAGDIALVDSGLLFAGVSDFQDTLIVPEPHLCGPFVVAFDPIDGYSELPPLAQTFQQIFLHHTKYPPPGVQRWILALHLGAFSGCSGCQSCAVSYTHLTLPTICSV